MPTESRTCFVLSPIGREGSETHARFREVLDFVIRPAVEQAGYDLEVLRADDIERPGSFIRDILQQLLDSFVVIADLTTQNPNVFYELGVRHSLSPRTILIAQSVEDIPSDLREYRTIVYDTTARGAALFRERLHKYLADVVAEPHRADNPVLDRLGSIIEKQTASLQKEAESLKRQLDSLLRKGTPAPTRSPARESVTTRVNRILKLSNAHWQFFGPEIVFGKGEHQRSVKPPTGEGNFKLYFVFAGESIIACWYVSAVIGHPDLSSELADVRVLMPGIKGLEVECRFVIVTQEDIAKLKGPVQKAFGNMRKYAPAKERKLLVLDLWDNQRITEIEQDLGIRFDVKPEG